MIFIKNSLLMLAGSQRTSINGGTDWDEANSEQLIEAASQSFIDTFVLLLLIDSYLYNPVRMMKCAWTKEPFLSEYKTPFQLVGGKKKVYSWNLFSKYSQL